LGDGAAARLYQALLALTAEEAAARLAQGQAPAIIAENASAPDQLGVEPSLVEASLQDALFVRNRFTILRLQRLL
jgi:hypothetical protein